MTASDFTLRRFAAPDGAELVFHEAGQGRPVVLLHGLFSDAQTNWIRYGQAKLLVNNGFRVILPDLRGHGSSTKSHDPAAYPVDVLTDDGLALVAHLGLIDYDLGGYSLGGRTVVRMVVRGAAPRRLVVSGMGLSGLTDTSPRTDHFKHILDNRGTFEKFTPEWNADSFLKTTRGDSGALRLLLDTFVDTSAESIAKISVPTLVLSGEDDSDNGSVEALAALLTDTTVVRTPGGHMSAVTKPELGQAIADFLTA
ncbi:alpha/beta fold hydrolase [Sphingomonas sp. SUN039]|uniref:alpha/beta fold hydrolase n=1 Tax=Sphingomonas sp. SUN039 TaxID=2937787 RepID=UPI0021646D6C|nr:alpha/beta hydrolase [Sphingomonas sp. SUN039]UVO53938.1 alpha/beta hydrolase [Sphingomonas sp. SUN039]